MISLPIPTAQGIFLARYSDHGLAELRFPEQVFQEAGDETQVVNPWHALTTEAVLSILDGIKVDRIPPLDLRGHSNFRLKVWRQLQRISIGDTATYAEVAGAIGQPGATRTVGGACGANPIPLIIPCHRVVRRVGGNQTLGGFSGGLNWKRKLLAVEGVVFGARSAEQRTFERFSDAFLSGARL